MKKNISLYKKRNFLKNINDMEINKMNENFEEELEEEESEDEDNKKEKRGLELIYKNNKSSINFFYMLLFFSGNFHVYINKHCNKMNSFYLYV